MRWRPDSPSIYLPNSGQIDLNAIGVEGGQANNSKTGLNDPAVRGLINKSSGAQNAMSEYYGASSGPNIGFGTMVYSEHAMRDQWSQGSTSSDMRGDWNLQASCSQGWYKVGKYSDLIMASNKRVQVTYDATISGSGFESSLWITYIPYRSSPKTGFNQFVSDSSSATDIKRELAKWRSASNGGQLYSADADGSGTHKLYTRGNGPSGRFSGSFWFDLRTSGPYQIGIEIWQTPSGSSSGAATMHSMTVT